MEIAPFLKGHVACLGHRQLATTVEAFTCTEQQSFGFTYVLAAFQRINILMMKRKLKFPYPVLILYV